MTQSNPGTVRATLKGDGVDQVINLDRLKANPFMRLIGLLQPPGRPADALYSGADLDRIMGWLRSVKKDSSLRRDSALAKLDIVQLGFFDKAGRLREAHAKAAQEFIWKNPTAEPDFRALVAHLRALEDAGDLERTNAANSGYPDRGNDYGQAGAALTPGNASEPMSRQQRRARERERRKSLER